jgi:hypothetical protein
MRSNHGGNAVPVLRPVDPAHITSNCEGRIVEGILGYST